VGDIHQPLHVGAAYVNEDDVIAIPSTATDVKNWFTEGDNFLKLGNKNFHSYWDSDTVKSSQRRAQALDATSYAAYLIKRFPTVPASPGSVDAWPAAWATETLAKAKLAHERISPGAREEVADHHGGRHDEWPVTLPPGYPTRAANIAAEQIAHGGRRLAAVLMAIWP
jgi:hypothetical protein